MKRQFLFMTLLFSVLLLFALNLQGDNTYTSHPTVSVDHSSFTKYVDILTNESTWYLSWIGGTASVYVSAGMEGVGQGQGTLTNISIMGQGPIGTWQDKESDAGTKDQDGPGSWRSGTGTASTTYPASIPPDAEDGDSWSWSSGGYTVIWPWEWHETTSWGVNVSIPTGVAGRYTTTGGWAKGTTVRRDASSASSTSSGPITLEVKYICNQCNASGKTKAAMGGKAAHEKITCPAPNCSVRYHKCSPPSSHAVCSACGDRKCDGDDHSYVAVCSDGYGPGYPATAKGCGKKIYECTRSDHALKTWKCGHSTWACNPSNHGDTTVTCPLGPNNQTCDYGPYYPCSPHTCTYSGGGNPPSGGSTLPCGHSSSASGDHSLQATCSSSNANGTCTVTSFYACQSHTHLYPTPPPPPEPTCPEGHTYDPSNSSEVNRHTIERTCRRFGCGQTWYRCVGKPASCKASTDPCWAINPWP
ncbi:hypothetical protein C6503_21315 [Candidatus Poribacteria bacterium]|nr:MAG: hypothetical protein C6503_21315 [Candidatus Poribacteria bacterium]